MEYNKKLKEQELIDIESGERSNGGNERMKNKSLNRLVSGVLGLTHSNPNDAPSINISEPNIDLFVDVNQKDQELVPLVGISHKKDEIRSEKAKKPPKPPRPPRGPFMDAADMRVVREIYKMATKKRERVERMRELKKLKAAKSSSSSESSSQTSPTQSSPSSSSLSSPPPPSSSEMSPGSTISIMIITFLFCLVIIFQGLDFSDSTNLNFTGAPQPAQTN